MIFFLEFKLLWVLEVKSRFNPYPIYRLFQFQSFQNYFPAHYSHYIRICVMTLLVPTLKRKICSTLVGNSCTLQVGYGSLGWFYHRLLEQFESMQEEISTDARISSLLLLEFFSKTNCITNTFKQEVLDFWFSKSLVPTEQRKLMHSCIGHLWWKLNPTQFNWSW